MDTNPYAAPEATVDDVRAWDAQGLEERKAGRGKRLGAALLDGLINAIWALPMVWSLSMAADVKHGIKPAAPAMGLLMLGLLLLLGVFVVNCVMLHRSGQTIGKRMLDIAIVRTDGSRMSLPRYLFIRVLPVGLLGAIPWVGWVVSLIDPLLIFGRDRRCLHDLIADTIVVDV
ncbi:RDD family protein [Rhodanobacter lindaniclasticus]